MSALAKHVAECQELLHATLANLAPLNPADFDFFAYSCDIL